jgi:hypothetical protein
MDGSEEKGSCVSEADCMGLNREREKGGGGGSKETAEGLYQGLRLRFATQRSPESV